MGNILKRWVDSSLILRILIFIIIGALLAFIVPKASWIGIFGDVFRGALKAIAPVLVFFLVCSALSKFHPGLGKRFRTVIILYIASTFLAALIAALASFVFPITIKLAENTVTDTPPEGIGEVFRTLVTNMVANPIETMASGNYIGILFWAILTGLALKAIKAEKAIELVNDFANAITQCVKWIIQFAPFGIMGLVYTSVTENGMSIFRDYGKLALLLVGCMLTVSLVANPIISSILLKRNSYPLVLRCLKDSGITAFFTRSSAANIPVNMQLCDSLGLEKDFYSVCIPLGATINMDGAAITINVLTLALAHTMGISVDLPTAIVLSFLATLGACGASGVPSGSLLLIPMACSLFGISGDAAMQAVSVGFIVSVIQDSLETALNSSGDVLFAATAEFREKLKKGETISFFEKRKKHDAA